MTRGTAEPAARAAAGSWAGSRSGRSARSDGSARLARSGGSARSARAAALRARLRVPADCTWLGLALVVLAAVVLVGLPEPVRAPASAAPLTLGEAFPGARTSSATGGAHTPLAYLDLDTPVSVTNAGDVVRLVVGDRVVRELPAAGSPRFAVATPPDALVWLELSDVTATGSLWRSGPRGEDPTRVTADTGRVVLLDSQYDLVVHDGLASWATVVGEDTEVRTVPVAGGPVGAVRLSGRYTLSAWPWATAAEVEAAGSSRLADLRTGAVTTVRGEGVELVDCTPEWCRVQVLRQSGTARLDLMRPDGSSRRRVGGREVRPAVVDVVLLDRFAVVVDDGRGALALYDTRGDRTADLATGFGTVLARGPFVWWSTGENTALTWHVVDLRTL
ncbi:hypothetical protein AB0A74_38550 [Saccharothrix sp. NPDC042600]|uniref:hypothetical protein n=1 Tax=Saccharothrix TaxID=2071 RepID=UPI0033E180B1|nr:hypothetical protein GCM10017745_33880 [Saccharothrix mutabilis subsp. capreolus]